MVEGEITLELFIALNEASSDSWKLALVRFNWSFTKEW